MNIRTGCGGLSSLVLASALAACGGGGGGDSSYNEQPNPMQRQAPQIVGLEDQTIPQDTTVGPLDFQVSDADSDLNAIAMQVATSDASVVPTEGIVIGGAGGSRTLQITPAEAAIGHAAITVRAVDPDGLTAERVVRVQVDGVFVSFRTTTEQIMATGESEEVRSLAGITLTPDADDDPTVFEGWFQ